MSENLARCRRCHDVFDPEAGVCPRCGTPWQPIPAPPAPEEGTYADRYAGTEFAVASETHVVRPKTSPSMALVAGGAALLVVALAVGTMFAAGVFAGAATPPPIIVSLRPATPPPATPTIRPEIAMTLSTLNDPSLSTHVVIQSRIDQDAVITGHPYSAAASFDCVVSNGEEMGTLTANGRSEEIRFVDGVYYLRQIPGTKWTKSSSISSYVVLLPLFDLTSSKMLDFVADETLNGQQAYHLKTTRYWVPDLNKMAFSDVSTLGTKPDTTSLDLWTNSFGNPVYATFSGTTTASDGHKLLDIETTFTFSDFGTPVDVVNPFATPTPSPPPSPTQ